MNSIIEVTEFGSNRKLGILTPRILQIEPLTYNSGETVTIIHYTDNKTIHVKETYAQVAKLLRDRCTCL